MRLGKRSLTKDAPNLRERVQLCNLVPERVVHQPMSLDQRLAFKRGRHDLDLRVKKQAPLSI